MTACVCGGWILTWKKHKENFWAARSILYHDEDVDYMSAHIYSCKLYLNFEKLKKRGKKRKGLFAKIIKTVWQYVKGCCELAFMAVFQNRMES